VSVCVCVVILCVFQCLFVSEKEIEGVVLFCLCLFVCVGVSVYRREIKVYVLRYEKRHIDFDQFLRENY